MAAILEHEPSPIGDLPEHQGAALERLIRKALSKAPDDRWQTARDLKDELEWIAAEKPAPAPQISPRRKRRGSVTRCSNARGRAVFGSQLLDDPPYRAGRANGRTVFNTPA